MRVTIIATSLNEKSKSQALARIFEGKIEEEEIEVDLFDLRELQLPLCGSASSWESANTKLIAKSVAKSTHVVFSVPIYCYDVNAAAKNVIELIGSEFTKKVVSFICSAGGSMSYMSVMGFANHLMLDFRSVIVPRFLYVSPDDWKKDELSEATLKRVDLLLEDMKAIEVKV